MNGVLAASDVFAVKAAIGGLCKGAIRLGGPFAWKQVRARLGKEGFLEPGQHGHHWFFTQKGWSRDVPDWVKNQRININPMPSPEVHGRITGPYKELPQFNLAQQYWYGTPAWAKTGTGLAVGHSAVAARQAVGPVGD